MKNLKVFLTILLFITTTISAFSQEENRRNFFAGLGYTGSMSLDKGTGNSIVTLYGLYFFKEKKYYALVDFVGSKFFQQEKKGYYYVRASSIGAGGGVKCIGGKKSNLYADAGGGFGYGTPEDYENKYIQVGLRCLRIPAISGFDFSLHYLHYFFNARQDAQIAFGMGFSF